MCESGGARARLAPFRCAVLLREMLGGHPAHPRTACGAPSLATAFGMILSMPADLILRGFWVVQGVAGDLAVLEADHPAAVVGDVLVMGHHHDGVAALVQL